MNNEIKNGEINAFSQIVLVVVMVCFSVLLAIRNSRSQIERWMLPVFLAFAVVGLIIHIMDRLSEKIRIYIYSAIIFFELFYYIMTASSVFDSTPLVMFMFIVLAVVHDKQLIWICCIVSCFAMVFRFFGASSVPNPDIIEHIVIHLILTVITTLLLTIMLSNYWREKMSLKERITDLEDENELTSDFLANVSHEIRTPINAVIGLTGVCLEKTEDEELGKDLKSVSDAGVCISRQINDMLDYSEIEMDKLVVNMSDYDLSSILNDLVAELKPVKDPSIELVIDVDSSLPETMRTDTEKLKKILWHVIENGLKNTYEGGVYVHITSISHEYGINLCIDVTDTGIGMSEEEIENIFNRFYQSDSGSTRRNGGLGLGMPIVRGFVRALNGFVNVSSNENEGTNVHISIPQTVTNSASCMALRQGDQIHVATYLKFETFSNPAVRDFYDKTIRNLVSGLKVTVHSIANTEELSEIVNDPGFTHLIVGQNEYRNNIILMEEIAKRLTLIVVCDEDMQLKDGSEAIMLRKPFYCFPVINLLNTPRADLYEGDKKMYLKGIKALVVDDEPMNLTVAEAVFRRYKMTVDSALSGPEAIDMCKAKRYDIIFMDHMMPQMDGIEAARLIRQDAYFNKQDTAIIALTANAASTARELFASEGFNGFVSKPIVLAELERTLKNALPASAITYGFDDGETDQVPAAEENESPQAAGVPAAEGNESLPDAGASEKDEYEMLREAGVSTKAGLEYCMDDKSLYEEILLEYAADSKEKTADLERFLAEEDWENYKIRVHAVKSSSRTVGAEELFLTAQRLEGFSGEGNGDEVRKLHPGFIVEYKKLTELISDIFGKKSITDPGR
ncbi:MAG: response regulator [Lachnospiraceae bacterium]|nr:response regulator [Lachnospiraceae bacterium]